ncbi:hypothetical protein ACOME3_009237 [Neoechinorhynchus agilis]
MTVLSVAVATNTGRVLVARQFVEMSRNRVESLLSSFSKLIGKSSLNTSNSQHTFVETEEVRYVYQCINNRIYAIVLTTLASNMIEDLETLQLVSMVITDCCRPVLTEKEVTKNTFSLLFALDEIIALGYRENLNTQQLKAILEMDSHDEKVFLAMRDSQLREAKEKMKEKARELDALRKKPVKSGGVSITSTQIQFIHDKKEVPSSLRTPAISSSEAVATYQPIRPRKGLKLGSSKRKTSNIIDEISSSSVQPKFIEDEVDYTPIGRRVHFQLEEKISATYTRDAGFQSMEVSGTLYCTIHNEEFRKIRIKVDTSSRDFNQKPLQIQTHPHIDKKLFQKDGIVGLRDSDKPFPLNQSIFLLKWHLTSDMQSDSPLNVVCWPTKVSNGVEMTIEYHLNLPITLTNVALRIPLPLGAKTLVNSCSGEHEISNNSGSHALVWSQSVVDETNDQGLFEFVIQGSCTEDDLFPIHVNFSSTELICGVKVDQVYLNVSYDEEVSFSLQTNLVCSKFVVI